MTSVAIIPARGGSRRIPRKNIRRFLGKPMLAWSVEAAQKSGICGEVWVSTEDSRIARVAWELGCKLHPRASELAEDQIGTQEVMRAALTELWKSDMVRPEFAVCIYACAPTLLPTDLREAFLQVREGCPYVYVPGMFYFGLSEAFVKGMPLTDGQEISLGERQIDINEEHEWQQAKQIVLRMQKAAA